jgi:hypothetical protein
MPSPISAILRRPTVHVCVLAALVLFTGCKNNHNESHNSDERSSADGSRTYKVSFVVGTPANGGGTSNGHAVLTPGGEITDQRTLTYAAGTVVTVDAAPELAGTQVQWFGPFSGSGNRRTFTVDRDLTGTNGIGLAFGVPLGGG